MLDNRWMVRYGRLVKSEYFEAPDLHLLSDCLLTYWKTYKHVPTDPADIIDILGADHRDLIHSVYLGKREWELDYASDMVVMFAKEQAAKLAVLESLDDLERGDLTQVRARIDEASKIGQDVGDVGLSVKGDSDKWLYDAMTDKVPTGMIHLDIAMDGGLAPGELGVFVSPPNYGKSMALVNAGFGAAGPISRRNVVHFSLEMSDKVVAKRYAARQVFRFPSRGEDPEEYKKEFEAKAAMLMPGEVRVFRVTGNVNDLRARAERFRDESGLEIGLLIVDYGELVKPLIARNDEWMQQGDIFISLREFAHDFECPLWTATQAGRHALNKEIITMADLAESFRKASVSDAMVAICQTVDEEKADQCRLFLAKLRDGESRAMIAAKYYKRQQAIITTGFV